MLSVLAQTQNSDSLYAEHVVQNVCDFAMILRKIIFRFENEDAR